MSLFIVQPDLPRYIWKLLHNRHLLSLLVTSLFGAYFNGGYVPNISRFVQTHYQRSAGTAFLLQGRHTTYVSRVSEHILNSTYVPVK